MWRQLIVAILIQIFTGRASNLANQNGHGSDDAFNQLNDLFLCVIFFYII